MSLNAITYTACSIYVVSLYFHSDSFRRHQLCKLDDERVLSWAPISMTVQISTSGSLTWVWHTFSRCLPPTLHDIMLYKRSIVCSLYDSTTSISFSQLVVGIVISVEQH